MTQITALIQYMDATRAYKEYLYIHTMRVNDKATTAYEIEIAHCDMIEAGVAMDMAAERNRNNTHAQ